MRTTDPFVIDADTAAGIAADAGAVPVLAWRGFGPDPHGNRRSICARRGLRQVDARVKPRAVGSHVAPQQGPWDRLRRERRLIQLQSSL